MTREEEEAIREQIRINSAKIEKIQTTINICQGKIEYWKSTLANHQSKPKPKRNDYNDWYSYNKARLTQEANIGNSRSALRTSITEYQQAQRQRSSLLDENRRLRELL